MNIVFSGIDLAKMFSALWLNQCGKPVYMQNELAEKNCSRRWQIFLHVWIGIEASTGHFTGSVSLRNWGTK